MAEITIKDIAKECGVGVSTVSRALNNHPDINPETRRKIMEVIERTGFIPNNSARNLKRTDAKCIAMLVKGITNPFFSKMIEIIEDEAKRKRYALVLRHVEAQEDELDVALELEKEKRLRGIVFLGGMTMVMLGLVGEYIGRMYISMNNAPQFVIRETINDEE